MAEHAATTAARLDAAAAEPTNEADEADEADLTNEADCDARDDVDDVDSGSIPPLEEPAPSGIRGWLNRPLLAQAFSVLVVVAMAGLCGWLGMVAHHNQQDEQRRALLLQVGRQGALNLTTIDYEHAENDVQLILDSATGQFRDDFSQRSAPFVDVVKQAKSKSVGTITEAGIESDTGDQAQVLVAISVKTSVNGTSDDQPRAWRMRIDVEKVGNDAKVSNVEFVP